MVSTILSLAKRAFLQILLLKTLKYGKNKLLLLGVIESTYPPRAHPCQSAHGAPHRTSTITNDDDSPSPAHCRDAFGVLRHPFDFKTITIVECALFIATQNDKLGDMCKGIWHVPTRDSQCRSV